MRLTETLHFYNPECVATASHIALVQQLSVAAVLQQHIGADALSGFTTAVKASVANDGIQLSFSFTTAQSNLGNAQAHIATAAEAITGLVRALDETSANADCIFFETVDYNTTSSAEVINNPTHGSNNSNGGGGSSLLQIYIASGVGGVLVVTLIIIMVVRHRRRSAPDEGGFSLGQPPLVAGAGRDSFENPLLRIGRARNANMDNRKFEGREEGQEAKE